MSLVPGDHSKSTTPLTILIDRFKKYFFAKVLEANLRVLNRLLDDLQSTSEHPV